MQKAVGQVEDALNKNRDVLVYTSRTLVASENSKKNLDIGRTVSKGLVDIVRSLRVQPRSILAKGGITSSDIATHGLGIKRGWVKGQILPGVPLWECGRETRWPGLANVVFPGNVGEEDALLQALKILQEPVHRGR